MGSGLGLLTCVNSVRKSSQITDTFSADGKIFFHVRAEDGDGKMKEMFDVRNEKRDAMRLFFQSVAQIGLEPIQTEPESGVLPLHHWAIWKDLQK